MRFHCLLPVRDEADILDQTLRHALNWADLIYVFDTGSVDQSWEIVQDHAAKDSRVIPVKKQAVFFSETHLRSYLFDLARLKMANGDWFLRMDADEIHHISPRHFVESCMLPYETLAYHQYYDFRLLQSEVDEWNQGLDKVTERSRPIEDRRRHYTISAYSEPRLCRYRETMQWPAGISFPYNAGYVAKQRLPIRHYPHRDPEQLQRRCHLRALMMQDPTHDQSSYLHWRKDDWKAFVTLDNEKGLQFWKQGDGLPEVCQFNHLRNPLVRWGQRLLHEYFLSFMDRQRQKFTPENGPIELPTNLIKSLEQALG
jgi:glycosyltransferase involved in cell wall biosynthesis